MMDKNKIIFSPAVCFSGNGRHLGFYGTHQGANNFKTAGSYAVKNYSHIMDIQQCINEEMYASVFSFVE